jgi:hypothetical protein
MPEFVVTVVGAQLSQGMVGFGVGHKVVCDHKGLQGNTSEFGLQQRIRWKPSSSRVPAVVPKQVYFVLPFSENSGV